MSYTVITSHPWQTSERELFERLYVEIVRAADCLWEFETSLLLIEVADSWRHNESKTTEEMLDAVEFFISTWLSTYREKLDVIKESVDSAHLISGKLRTEVRLGQCR